MIGSSRTQNKVIIEKFLKNIPTPDIARAGGIDSSTTILSSRGHREGMFRITLG